MAGDGVSLPTTLAQMGSVAKTQARGMQQAQTATPFSDRADKQEELRVNRVQETKEQENGKIKKDGGGDKRQRRRQRRQRRNLEDREDAAAETMNDEEDDNEQDEALGSLIDLRA